MKKIALSGKIGEGKFTLVDDEDFEWLNKRKWSCSAKNYVTNNHGLMHTLLLNKAINSYIDHRDGNPLNNQKSNLRICTISQNAMNQKKQKKRFSIYKGVSLMAFRNKNSFNKWQSYLTFNQNRYYFGSYPTEHLAGLMYDFWALELFGKFARTNFPVVKHNFF